MTQDKLIELQNEASERIHRLEHDLPWIYYDAYLPTRRSAYTEGSNGHPVESCRSEGNDKARRVFNSAARHVNRATHRPMNVIHREHDLKDTLRVLRALGILISKMSEPRLQHVCSCLHLATLDLAHFLGSPEETPLEVSYCPTCQIREARGNSECSTCASYRHRKGCARPRSLDKGKRPYDEAKANQAKHGIGYGIR